MKGDKPAYTFKISDLNFHFLSDKLDYRLAPYFANRGMKWIRKYGVLDIEDDELMYYTKESHRIAFLGLTKKAKRTGS